MNQSIEYFNDTDEDEWRNNMNLSNAEYYAATRERMKDKDTTGDFYKSDEKALKRIKSKSYRVVNMKKIYMQLNYCIRQSYNRLIVLQNIDLEHLRDYPLICDMIKASATLEMTFCENVTKLITFLNKVEASIAVGNKTTEDVY